MSEEEAMAWVHEIEQLNQRLVKERDEARSWARDAWQMITYADKRQMFDPPPDWLNEQPTVDEKGEGAVL